MGIGLVLHRRVGKLASPLQQEVHIWLTAWGS